ncbi:DUF2798 domain-containing protein [Elioraea tepida]|jgi:hypothetical protein|uniref:DUF2798 domain-containing protein n=1 Tax=Elioraea tepida TaxID=2843330 RepID=A0A975U1H7_9PROT|nr:DUF2798 domain-containing protein [Elioraea tepida]QXM24584.1 DUF2798 domain-containing protein [Elioraea tepida]
MRLPARYGPVLFGFLLSGLMSLVVSGIATLKALGPVREMPGAWIGAWAIAWTIAFPTVLVVAPLVRRIVAAVTEPAGR